YSSTDTRKRMSDALKACLGWEPDSWQIDLAETTIVRLDAIGVSPTGSGKTIPIMLPLLLPENKRKVTVVISPLNSLEFDQATRFECVGIHASVVNRDTWSTRLRKAIEGLTYQILFMSPEMATRNRSCRDMLQSLGHRGDLLTFVIDEAHCISQWGGDFRTAYCDLNKLRAYARAGTPIMALSATLAPQPWTDVEQVLQIDPSAAFYLNRGNNRPNIKMCMKYVESSSDFAALADELNLPSIRHPEDIPKTLIFVESKLQSMRVWRYLLEHTDPSLHDAFAFIHAGRTQEARDKTFQQFKDGKIRVVLATECVAMGVDASDIERVIQLGVPLSLSTWVQRAGRGGRSAAMKAVALLLVEKSVSQPQTRRETQSRRPAADSDSDGENEPGPAYRKTIDPSLRLWIETRTCRRKSADRYFNNPPREDAKHALEQWRRQQAQTRYARRAYSIMAVLPDDVLKSVAYDARIRTPAALEEKVPCSRWPFVKRHGQAIIEVLLRVDARHEMAKAAK
ncbi:P-loop containing nucleoside triphosphate hydrolase protein, partial [Daedalea quercina L-15889]